MPDLRIRPALFLSACLCGCGGAADAPCSASWYATAVVSVRYGPGTDGDFGQSRMPGIVYGPPKGGGTHAGSVDVVKLGKGGAIVVGFDRTIVDGPGVDFAVYENPFYIGDDPNRPYADLGIVAASQDGRTWTEYPCTATQADTPPFGQCAGWHPVFLNSDDAFTPPDPATCGGDLYDLHDLGLKWAKFVRITDRGIPGRSFDLDAVGIVNAAPDCQ